MADLGPVVVNTTDPGLHADLANRIGNAILCSGLPIDTSTVAGAVLAVLTEHGTPVDQQWSESDLRRAGATFWSSAEGYANSMRAALRVLHATSDSPAGAGEGT